MKTGLITLHHVANCGALLQAYALSRAIGHLGHECQIIDCRLERETKRTCPSSWRPAATLKRLYLATHRVANRRFFERFDAFRADCLPLTESVYTSAQALRLAPPVCDAYVTGSDQVWNPGLLDRPLGDLYHLGFASPERARLVAYAPSFGTDRIADRYVEPIRKRLARYHALSARESRGQAIIQELIGKQVPQVLDPALLLRAEDYADLIRPTCQSKPYILVYPMELGPDGALVRLAKGLKKALSLPLVVALPAWVDGRWLTVADRVVLDAGPCEFLGLIQNAAFVCTNSFHGTVFSILMRRPFAGVPHSRTNGRLTSLLALLGLEERQTSDITPARIAALVAAPIDAEAVQVKLEVERKASIDFLRKALVG